MTRTLTEARSAGLLGNPENQSHSSTTAASGGDADLNATTTQVLERISVAAPYFAFTDLERDEDGWVRASVPTAIPSSPERGAMIADQIARHLAILGSCAAALDLDGEARHHYLATRAEYERLGEVPTEPIRDGLWARATARWHDKRTASAETELCSGDGTVLNRLRVDYAVLKPRMFERFNPPVEGDPLAPADVLSVIEPGRVVRDCGGVDEAMCRGHFPGHPAAPVALLMGRLVATTADAMQSRLGSSVDYLVESGMVAATGLAQAGQHLVLHGQYESDEGDGLHLLSGDAQADGETVGEVSVVLRAMERG
ncbi:MAG: hypothetical protein AAF567_02710 [Actinomycetota bacterium]